MSILPANSAPPLRTPCSVGAPGTDGAPPTAGDPGGTGSLGVNMIINYRDTNFGIIASNINVSGIVAFSSGGTGGDGGVVVIGSVAPSMNIAFGSGIKGTSAGSPT